MARNLLFIFCSTYDPCRVVHCGRRSFPKNKNICGLRVDITPQVQNGNPSGTKITLAPPWHAPILLKLQALHSSTTAGFCCLDPAYGRGPRLGFALELLGVTRTSDPPVPSWLSAFCAAITVRQRSELFVCKLTLRQTTPKAFFPMRCTGSRVRLTKTRWWPTWGHLP